MVGNLAHPILGLREWADDTAVLVGGGPSLTRGDVEYCQGRAKVIAVNNAYAMARWADILYACDVEWWDYHYPIISQIGHAYEKWTCSQVAAQKYGLHYIGSESKPGLSFDPLVIHTGNNSGYQALNLAVLFGSKRIILLGFDMQLDRGKSHWFGEHPGKLGKRTSNYKKMIDSFQTTVPDLQKYGITVLNCSRHTALDCFPKVSLENVL